MSTPTNFLLDQSGWLAQHAVNLLVQSTLLVTLGLVIARLFRGQGSAVQSAIYRGTLVAVLGCPCASLALNLTGTSGWMLKLPSAKIAHLESKEIELGSPVNESANEKEAPSRQEPETGPELAPSLARFEAMSIDSPLPTEPFAASKMESNTEESAQSDGQFYKSTTTMEIPAQRLAKNSESIPRLARFLISAYGLISFVWLLGTTFFLIRLWVAFRRTGRIRQHSFPASKQENSLCRQLANQIKVRPPKVRKHALLHSPCLTGIVDPAILLPSEIDQDLPLQKALAHELAHLWRRDTFWNLLQQVSLSIFFFQPLMWRLVYRLETTAEEVCDDFVVRHCLDRTGYAQQLVDLAESGMMPASITDLRMFAGRRSLLNRRIARILDTTRKLTTQISPPTLLGIITLALVAATVGGFLGSERSPNRLNLDEASKQVSNGEISGTADKQVESAETLTIKGLVVDDQGRPCSAEVFIDGKEDNRIQTGPDGAFSVEVETERLYTTWPPKIHAVADGFGLAVARLDSKQLTGLELQLVADDHPIEGTVIDIEGNPVAGAIVRIKDIKQLQGITIQEFLQAAVKRNASLVQLPRGISFKDPRIKPITTDAKGKFRIDNIGSDRIATVEIFGETAAFQQIRVITGPARKVAVKSFSGYGVSSKTPIFGHEPLIPCGPSVPIEGVVFDRETKQPLAGIKVTDSRMSGSNVGGFRYLNATTDENGRFRLIGMPLGKGNVITLIPARSGPNSLPYFPEDCKVPIGDGAFPSQMEIGLRRGQWIRGKVVEQNSNKPIMGARVDYRPYLDHPIATKLDLYTEGKLADLVEYSVTDSEGRFQVVGLPGQGVVSVWSVKEHYPLGQGWDEIDDKRIDNKGRIKVFGYPLQREFQTAFKEVLIEEGSHVNDFDFSIDPGKSIRVKMIDSEGKPIQNVRVSRARSNVDKRFVSKTDQFEASSFLPGQSRVLEFLHPERGVGTYANISHDTPSPITVQLKPLSRVRAKLVDGKGDPVAGALVRINYRTALTPFYVIGDFTHSDENGLIEFENIAHGDYAIGGEDEKRIHFTVIRNLAVNANEFLDLGTVDISQTEPVVEIKRMPLKQNNKGSGKQGVKQDSSNSSAPEEKRKRETITFSGIVVDDQGQPHSAEVYLQFRSKNVGPKASTKADGSFQLEVDTDFLKTSRLVNIIAEADGFGLAVQKLDWSKREQLRLQLTPDNHPIQGKVIDTEGNPIEGATVRLREIQHFESSNLNDYLNAAAKPNASLQQLPYGTSFHDHRIKPVKNGTTRVNFAISQHRLRPALRRLRSLAKPPPISS